MSEQPLISIIIANYNYGRFIETAIQSVLNQSFKDFELIIVDGGSTDNSVEVIQGYSNKLAWWCSEKDRGQSHAFNKGFAKARGKFLTWLNADDVLLQGGLEAIAKEIARFPDCKWFIGSCIWFDQELRVERCFRAHRFSYIRNRWSGHLSVGGPSSFFSTQLLKCVGGVDESLHFMMDTDLWLKFYLVYGAKYRRTVAYVWGYRIHAASKMSGPVVDPERESNKRNRVRLREEAMIVAFRHGKIPKWIKFLATAITISPIDMLVCQIETWKFKNKNLMSIVLNNKYFLKKSVLEEYPESVNLK